MTDSAVATSPGVGIVAILSGMSVHSREGRASSLMTMTKHETDALDREVQADQLVGGELDHGEACHQASRPR